MSLLHSSSCKGPPLGCDRGYWINFIVIILVSIPELILAKIAGSDSAQADAIHMSFLHGMSYGNVLLISFLAKIKKWSPHQELQFRLWSAYSNIALVFAGLLYLVFWNALPKIWSPEPISGKLMLTGNLIGIFGTLVTILVLKITAKDHGYNNKHSQECDHGRKLTLKTIFFDAIQDLGISILVFTTAVLIIINPRFSIIDQYLTLFVVSIIFWQAVKLITSIVQEKEMHHHH